MKILVIGLGGVGGYLGTFLKKTDYKITFLCRGDRLNFLKKNGLTLNTQGKKTHFSNLDVRSEISNNEEYDFIINTVKLYDFDSILIQIINKVRNNFILLPFQNGIYSEEKIKNILDIKKTYGAVAQISSVINSNNEIDHKGKLATFFVGPYSRVKDEKLINFCFDCQNVGLDIRYTENIEQKIWEKFIFLSAYSGLTTLTEKTIGEIFENTTLKKKFIDAMFETYNLSLLYGIKFKINPVDKWIEKISHMPFEMTSSMFHDFKAKKKLELKWLSGFVVSNSEEKGIECPVHKKIVEGIESK
jgi:2-dehydropantoate 2-reductase